MRLVLRTALASVGYEVVEAEDGQTALEQLTLRRTSFDLVLLDLQMPRMDGMELLRRLRDAGDVVPVVILTAHGSIPEAVAAMKLGAIDFLTKPITPEALGGSWPRSSSATQPHRREAHHPRAEPRSRRITRSSSRSTWPGPSEPSIAASSTRPRSVLREVLAHDAGLSRGRRSSSIGSELKEQEAPADRTASSAIGFPSGTSPKEDDGNLA